MDGKCPDHQTVPEYIAEKNYFFKMSKYQGWLKDHIKKNPNFIRPERYKNEVLSLLESGELEDHLHLPAQVPADLGHRTAF